MDADQLRALQMPLKARYREDPASAVITLRADGTLGAEAVTCSVETGPYQPRDVQIPRARGRYGLAVPGNRIPSGDSVHQSRYEAFTSSRFVEVLP